MKASLLYVFDKRTFWNLFLAFIIILLNLGISSSMQPALAAGENFVSSSPKNGVYNVTPCITVPATVQNREIHSFARWLDGDPHSSVTKGGWLAIG